MMSSVWLGFDPKEIDAYIVAVESIRRFNKSNIPIRGLILHDQIQNGNYTRPYRHMLGGLYDQISDSAMSTEFSLTRFLTPLLAKTGIALYMDCDVMLRTDIKHLFDLMRDHYAVMCVKHKHEPKELIKMDDCLQLSYKRKNWSSVMLFNCDHPANKRLTLDMVNNFKGSDLHALCWLEDDVIGELDEKWNHLLGYSGKDKDPKIVHFTLGTPRVRDYYNHPLAEEWWEYLRAWAR